MHRPHRADHVFFDLDGTLVDSAPGIVLSLEHALRSCDVPCPGIDWRRLIGPPLPRMLEVAIPDLDDLRREAVVKAYRAHYAAIGVFETRAYPGIETVLDRLGRSGRPVHVVTNKPRDLANTIVHRLGFAPLVRRVMGGDPTGHTTKADRLALLVAEEGSEAGVFIGDSVDDLHAALRVGASFILAGWGYGAEAVLATGADARVAREPASLPDLLALEC